MNKPVIVGYSRSPFTLAKKGELINVRPEDLLSEVIKNLVIKSKINVLISCSIPCKLPLNLLSIFRCVTFCLFLEMYCVISRIFLT